jgi:type IX secretion system PorP/SprF family membrane protein
MKKTIYRIVLIFLCLTATVKHTLAQQNIQFTQYVFNTLSVNPAYAGYKEAWFLQAGHRMQWVKYDGAPVTTQVSIDGVTDSDSKRVGLGVQFTTDKLGPQSATSFYANYAYRIQLNYEDTKRLSFGLGAGFTQYGLDGSILDPVTDGDPNIPTEYKNSFIPDLRFGIYYNAPAFYIGFSAMDLLSGYSNNFIFNWDIGSTQNVMRKRHFYLLSGALFDFSENTKFRPGILIKEDVKGPTSLDLNAMFIFENRFWVGGSYRTAVSLWKKDYKSPVPLSKANSLSGIVQFQITDDLRIGYSYDYAIKGYNSMKSGTHELSLGLTLPGKNKRVLSPRFF